ncbi:MAG: response regulator [Planctomycetes bacterium]|nr:response regulator [Planctomycetota bacterium]
MSTQISVLVIEDEAHIRVALEYNLKMDGFDVTLTENGRAGLEKAKEIKPQLILCDWMMPEMNGLEVLDELKKDDELKDVPVFMLTAKGMSGDMEEALEKGADDYITKPFDPLKLGEMLREKLKGKVKI